MLTFSEYLHESGLKWKAHDFQSDDYGDVTHHGEVDNQGVTTYFRNKDKRHFSVEFSTNGRMSHRSDTDPRTNAKILHHVHGVVNSFIHHYEPHTLSFAGEDLDAGKYQQKNKVYGKFAQHLAKLHGGKVVSLDYNPHDEHRIAFA